MATPQFDDKESLIRLLGEARSELAECRTVLQELMKDRLMLYQELVGRDVVLAMQQDKSLAESYLEHPEVNFRFVALNVLVSHWKIDEKLAGTCERLINADHHLLVSVLMRVPQKARRPHQHQGIQEKRRRADDDQRDLQELSSIAHGLLQRANRIPLNCHRACGGKKFR